MKRLCGVLLLLCVGCAHSTFDSGSIAESTAERRARMQPRYVEPVGDLVGSWELTCEHPTTGWITFPFIVDPSGGLDWGFPNDETMQNDVWWQEGSEVHFFINDSYVDYAGHLLNNDEIEGIATNVQDASWAFTARRTKE